MLDLILTALLLIPKAFFWLLALASTQLGISAPPAAISFVVGKFVAVLGFMDVFGPADHPLSMQLVGQFLTMLSLMTWLLVVYIAFKIISLFRGVNATPES